MTLRERILSVYRGETPDAVPFMLDLSHWFYARTGRPWDLSTAYETPELSLIKYHKSRGVGSYLANLASFYTVSYADDVQVTATKADRGGVPEITWRIETPIGEIRRSRIWEPVTYAWGISHWGIKTEDDLRVFAYAMSRRSFQPRWDRYQAWGDAVGDNGVVYLSAGYSAMGHLLHYWMGVEQTVFAALDWPRTLHETVDAVNANTLELVGLLAESPAQIVSMGDNFSSDIQSPPFFDEWSRPYYEAAVTRLHAAGKHVSVHIDGRLRGAIRMIRETGADCGDAITPTPMGDLSPAECRAEAGADFILSGGVSPDLWLPNASLEAFISKAREWLELRRRSPRLIANAGDQVPPGADEDRIEIMRDLVEEEGKY
ncbi:MAG: hypothetical protein HN742_26605 [Lentisphaerae bacterium]|nr:hypothetical protein [Lentisphaerota bacterium]MBT4822497.1 hypothetical protein [Lentisphaerota bacterium]MBT5606035.1 hypothetical protein [Lentisphaerota bacterium]MBT7058576.1 hypothetical protein [Lentisphaerota bacterium]MBT7845474.1 hypothetical protein [Lentisphaerota bacterium]